MKLVVLTGAGMSAESGIKTFRDADGLWEGHDVMEVASPIGWEKNPELVLDFYNQRRRQLLEVIPNAAHTFLADLEHDFDVHIITQNVDDLHERAGSTNVLHLHGELLKAKSSINENYIVEWKNDLCMGELCPDKSQIRPHVVWFGEAVPAMESAMRITQQADIFIVIGTSLQVYPAAGLLDFVPFRVPIFYVDPKPANVSLFNNPVETIAATATQAIDVLRKKLKVYR